MIPPMSRDRFNSNVDRKVKTEATPIRRVEVITGVERRRDWTDEQKLSIIAESCQDGAVISDVARRHGLRPQQLFNWRNEFRKRKCGGTRAFAPVMIADDRPSAAPAETPARVADAPLIEIVLGGATVRTRGAVDAKALAAVLRAVKAVA
jgi:transposase